MQGISIGKVYLTTELINCRKFQMSYKFKAVNWPLISQISNRTINFRDNG